MNLNNSVLTTMACSNFHNENIENEISPGPESLDSEDIESSEDTEMWTEDEEPQPQTENDVTFELLCSHPAVCCRLFPIRAVEVLLENGHGIMSAILGGVDPVAEQSGNFASEELTTANVMWHVLWEAPSCDAIISILDGIFQRCPGVNPYNCYLILRSHNEVHEESLVEFGLSYCRGKNLDEEIQVRFFSALFSRGLRLFAPAIRDLTEKAGQTTEEVGETNIEMIFDEFCMEFFYEIVVKRLFLSRQVQFFYIEPSAAGVCQKLRRSIQAKFAEIDAEGHQIGVTSWDEREGFIWFMGRLTI